MIPLPKWTVSQRVQKVKIHTVELLYRLLLALNNSGQIAANTLFNI